MNEATAAAPSLQRVVSDETMKRCPRCKATKPARCFWKTVHQAGGLSSYCKKCSIAYKRERLRRDPKALDADRRSNRKRMARQRAEMASQGIARTWSNSWRKNSETKRKCYGKYRYALRTGRLVKPAECSVCGRTGQVQGHHTDDERPFEVVWLCVTCHTAAHRKTDKLVLARDAAELGLEGADRG